MHTKVLLLDKIMNYIVKRKGKQVRRCLCSSAQAPAAFDFRVYFPGRIPHRTLAHRIAGARRRGG